MLDDVWLWIILFAINILIIISLILRINKLRKQCIVVDEEINESNRKMINSIFELDDTIAHEIMTPRTDVFFIDIDDDREEYFEELMELTHSRIPVCQGDADNILGILHIKDYLHAAASIDLDKVDIKSLLRPAYFVPETKPVDALLYDLQREKQHLAILIDEYGGVSGVISVEDIVEQIVGDIDDEFDEEDRVIKKIDDNTYELDGNVYLDDLEDEIGACLDSDNSDTIGGYLIDLMGEVPKEKKNYSPIIQGRYEFTILKVQDRRIEKLKLHILPNEGSEDSE